jgi:hypothetical protein
LDHFIVAAQRTASFAAMGLMYDGERLGRVQKFVNPCAALQSAFRHTSLDNAQTT